MHRHDLIRLFRGSGLDGIGRPWGNRSSIARQKQRLARHLDAARPETQEKDLRGTGIALALDLGAVTIPERQRHGWLGGRISMSVFALANRTWKRNRFDIGGGRHHHFGC